MTVIHPPERSLPTRQELHEIQERRATKQTLAASPMQERVQSTPLKTTRLGPAFVIQAKIPTLLVGKYA